MTRLTPLAEADLSGYLDRLVRDYAADHVRGGRWTEAESLTEARKEVDKLLPDGLASPDQFLFAIVAGEPEAKVGELWLALEPRGGFVYDLFVDERYRRRGYAEGAMRLAEGIARQKGARTLSLHVFGDNAGARRLYARLGYRETNVRMSKSLEP